MTATAPAKRLTRAESQERTRGLIVEAASRLFLSQGFRVTSLEQIAEEAGFTRGAVYSNFEGKTAMGIAAIDELYAREERRLEAVLDDALDQSPDGWFEAFATWADATIGDPAWMRLEIEVAASSASDDGHRAATAARYARLRSRAAEMLGRAIRQRPTGGSRRARRRDSRARPRDRRPASRRPGRRGLRLERRSARAPRPVEAPRKIRCSFAVPSERVTNMRSMNDEATSTDAEAIRVAAQIHEPGLPVSEVMYALADAADPDQAILVNVPVLVDELNFGDIVHVGEADDFGIRPILEVVVASGHVHLLVAAEGGKAHLLAAELERTFPRYALRIAIASETMISVSVHPDLDPEHVAAVIEPWLGDGADPDDLLAMSTPCVTEIGPLATANTR